MNEELMRMLMQNQSYQPQMYNTGLLNEEVNDEILKQGMQGQAIGQQAQTDAAQMMNQNQQMAAILKQQQAQKEQEQQQMIMQLAKIFIAGAGEK